MVHRDIKPSNIAITISGLVKVLDFGLAKLIGSQGESAPTRSLTESHTVTGTLPYMSPEQLRGREVDSRTDIYALGVVLYEMATGRRPFASEISPQLIDDILNSPPLSPRQINGKVSLRLEEIVLKCLEKDPENRYQSAKEIAVDLRRMTVSSSASQRLTIQPKRSKRVTYIRWAAVPLLFVAVLMIAWVLYRTSYFAATPSVAVLPFVDESKDASSQYITDGITEGVIDKLSEIPALRVISRNSVFKFKGREADAQAVGRDLKVQSVLSGRVAHQADGVTISAELVNVSDGTQIWGRQFRYPISDLPRAQDELASAILGKLKLRLNSTNETRLAPIRCPDRANSYQWRQVIRDGSFCSVGVLWVVPLCHKSGKH